MSTNRQLESACANVCNAWIPVNPVSYQKISSGLSSGRYDKRLDLFIDDLKSDVSLFAYCVKQLKTIVAHDGTPVKLASFKNPVDLIKSIPLAEIKRIFSASEQSISFHRFEEINDLQAGQLRRAIVSAHASQEIAGKFEVDADAVFTCSMFRQLGLTLIAWNYPHVFKKALASVQAANAAKGGSDGADLDRTLSKTLGFSPATLGVALGREFGLPQDILAGMGDAAAQTSPSAEGESPGAMMKKLCEIGEALAQVQDPEHYPRALSTWSQAKIEIAPLLGADGLRQIEARCNSALELYSRALPEFFSAPVQAEPQQNLLKRTKTVLLANNLYIKHCPADVQQKLTALYSRLNPEAVSKDNIDILVKEIMPAAGFLKGCIYLVEPESLRLVPRLVIGTVPLGRFRAVNYVSTSAEFDPVVAAYRCKTPIMEDNVLLGEETISYIAGVIGTIQKAGVLYLEISESVLKSRGANPMVYYKAVRQALGDCLNLH